MEFTYDEVYVSNHAEAPDGNRSIGLPKEVSSEAAYVLTESVFGTEIGDIANDLGVSRSSVDKTLRDLKDSKLLDYSRNRRGRSYSPTEKGKEIMKSYMAEESIRSELEIEKESLDDPRVVLGNFEYATAAEEVELMLSYLGGDDRNPDDLEKDLGIKQRNLTRMRNSLNPLMQEKTEEYTITYEPTQLGLQVLGHLESMNFPLTQEIEDEVSNPDEEEDDVDWSQIT